MLSFGGLTGWMTAKRSIALSHPVGSDRSFLLAIYDIEELQRIDLTNKPSCEIYSGSETASNRLASNEACASALYKCEAKDSKWRMV